MLSPGTRQEHNEFVRRHCNTEISPTQGIVSYLRQYAESLQILGTRLACLQITLSCFDDALIQFSCSMTMPDKESRDIIRKEWLTAVQT